MKRAVDVRRWAYDSGVLPVHRMDGVTVVSVGNIRAGGSGKSPVAIYLSELLRDMGHPVCLLLRGYGGSMENRGGEVSVGGGPLVSARESGDEAFAAASRLEGVGIRVGADRVVQARAAAERGTRVIVLDDGFQHRRLHRDLDIVLVCPEDLVPGTRLIPAGPLRELPGAVERAHVVAGLLDDWGANPGAPEVLFDYRTTHRAPRREVVGAGSGDRVWLLAGIARPERFERSAQRAGFRVVGASFFRDHHRFSAAQLEAVGGKARAGGANAILTTEKDLARLRGMPSSVPISVLEVDAVPVEGEEILRREILRLSA